MIFSKAIRAIFSPSVFSGQQFGRIQGMFELYFEKDAYDELSLEHDLSQLFFPKQKELESAAGGGHQTSSCKSR